MVIKSYEIRNIFLEYFKLRNHTILNSSSLVPKNDNSLLFTNSGMNQFKEYFLGIKDTLDVNYVTVQRCLRISGKHNDFKNIGNTNWHNTFFEMMGNFSFGVYFKKEAIIYAWDFLTNKKFLNISKDKLIVTVNKDDIDTYDIWLNIIKLCKNNIILTENKGIYSKNFWSIGKTGLCGYCTEIFYNIDFCYDNKRYKLNRNFIEIWNLVFIEYNLDYKNKLSLLSRKCIDTGMGLERITAVLQNVKSNFDIDIFIDIKFYISNILNIKILPKNIKIFNILADHLRSIIYLIKDGIIPSNEHRGYVLRKIIRRSLVYLKFLDINDLILYKVIKIILLNLYYKYLFTLDIINLIIDLVYKEEKKFYVMLNYSLNLLDFYIKKIISNKKKYLSSKIVFLLYDTYGLPLDLLKLICTHYNIFIDIKKFNIILNYQRKKSRSNQLFSNNKFNNIILLLKNLVITKFKGFKHKEINSKIILILNKDILINYISSFNGVCIIILDKTIFFPKSCGLLGDRGYIKSYDNSSLFIVKNTYKLGNYILHSGYILYGCLKLNDLVILKYDSQYRLLMARNHTCLHILCYCIKVFYKNSNLFIKSTKVREDYFSLDINKKINNYIIIKLENNVNYLIWQNLKINYEFINDEKLFINKNFNFFGKNIVRIVWINNLYKEYCAGVHIKQTNNIGIFKIVRYNIISNNNFRIVGITNFNALLDYSFNSNIIIKINNLLKCNNLTIYSKIVNLLNKYKKLYNKEKKLNIYIIKDLINIFNKSDIKIYKNFKFILRRNIKTSFINKNIFFVFLNKLYNYYKLSFILINLINKDNVYYIILLDNKIFNLLDINFIKNIKKKIYYKNYLKVKNNNFFINIFYIKYDKIIKLSILDYIYNYIIKFL